MNWLTQVQGILAVAGIAGAVFAVLLSTKASRTITLQAEEITALDQRLQTETAMRIDCQNRLTELEKQSPTYGKIIETLTKQHADIMKILAKKK